MTVELRPLAEEDDEALFAALTPNVWRLATTPFGRSREEFAEYLAGAREAVRAGTAEVYVVWVDGVPSGMTRLWRIDRVNRGAEIGFTWYRESLWGSAVNAACKLWMLTRAFEEMGLIRVYFRIDERNERSQGAVARLGAVREGVLRKELVLPHDAHVRSTVIYSILDDEWPEVRAGLRARLSGSLPA